MVMAVDLIFRLRKVNHYFSYESGNERLGRERRQRARKSWRKTKKKIISKSIIDDMAHCCWLFFFAGCSTCSTKSISVFV